MTWIGKTVRIKREFLNVWYDEGGLFYNTTIEGRFNRYLDNAKTDTFEVVDETFEPSHHVALRGARMPQGTLIDAKYFEITQMPKTLYVVVHKGQMQMIAESRNHFLEWLDYTNAYMGSKPYMDIEFELIPLDVYVSDGRLK